MKFNFEYYITCYTVFFKQIVRLFYIYIYYFYICKYVDNEFTMHSVKSRDLANQPNNACCHNMAQRSARHGGSDVFAFGQALRS